MKGVMSRLQGDLLGIGHRKDSNAGHLVLLCLALGSKDYLLSRGPQIHILQQITYLFEQSELFELSFTETTLAWLAVVSRPKYEMKASSVNDHAYLGTFSRMKRDI